MTRFVRAALLAAAIALTAPATAGARDWQTVGYVLAPGQQALLAFYPFDCDASNLSGSWVYHKHLYRSATYSYMYWDYFGSPRAVWDQRIAPGLLENRGTVYVRIWCWY